MWLTLVDENALVLIMVGYSSNCQPKLNNINCFIMIDCSSWPFMASPTVLMVDND